MRYEHVVEFTRADRNRNIDEIVSSLLHSAVDKNLFPRRLQVMTAPCNLMLTSSASTARKIERITFIRLFRCEPRSAIKPLLQK